MRFRHIGVLWSDADFCGGAVYFLQRGENYRNRIPSDLILSVLRRMALRVLFPKEMEQPQRPAAAAKDKKKGEAR